MNLRAFGIIAAGLLLCGCTDADWDNMTSYVGGPPRTAESAPPPMQRESDAAPMQDAAAPPPTQGETGPAPRPPASQVAASDTFCKGVGDSAGFQAGYQGFDPAYQAGSRISPIGNAWIRTAGGCIEPRSFLKSRTDDIASAS